MQCKRYSYQGLLLGTQNASRLSPAFVPKLSRSHAHEAPSALLCFSDDRRLKHPGRRNTPSNVEDIKPLA